MASLKTLCGLAGAMLILAGCGNGSNSSSPSASATSSPASATGTSGSTSGSTSTPTSSSGSNPPPSSPTPSNPPPSNPPTSSTGGATLTWTAPTADNNGSALTNLAGYHIYYGTSAASLSKEINVASPSTLTYSVTGLSQGTWYFGITAYTNTGLESAMSNVGSKTIS